MGREWGDKAYVAAADMGLTNAGTRLLVFMALKASDSDREPRFFGGLDLLAVGAGWNRRRTAERAPARHRARRIIGELIKANAIERCTNSRPGQNAEYVLTCLCRTNESGAR